jgi:hypothetical protein
VPAPLHLLADCAACDALCCVGPVFAASADFPIDKPAGTPCPNLGPDSRCTIHAQLRPRGFVGCTVYDCFGAGQRVTQQILRDTSWRDGPSQAAQVFAVFEVVRALHELLSYVGFARQLPLDDDLLAALADAHDQLVDLAAHDADNLRALDVDAQRATVNPMLLAASETVRTRRRADAPQLRGAHLVGARLHRADLRAASLRGALLVGADLHDADLRGADLLAADLRGADLRGADLRDALFVVQSQLDAAQGDQRTRVPDGLTHPAHWARPRG